MKTFEINEKLATEILNYLASKPYIEVATIINELQQLKSIKESDNNIKE